MSGRGPYPSRRPMSLGRSESEVERVPAAAPLSWRDASGGARASCPSASAARRLAAGAMAHAPTTLTAIPRYTRLYERAWCGTYSSQDESSRQPPASHPPSARDVAGARGTAGGADAAFPQRCTYTRERDCRERRLSTPWSPSNSLCLTPAFRAVNPELWSRSSVPCLSVPCL